MSGYDVHALREREFPWAARGESIYLNHASIGPLPMRAREARRAFESLRDEPFRITADDQFGTLARARATAARLLGAEAAEIALMVNTSYGINVAARALRLRPGDAVLTFDREFPANIYPWMALPGVRLIRVPVTDGLPDEPALLAALDSPAVRVVTVSWVQFATGYRVDLARLGAECRSRGIILVVDAIQGVGAHPLDVHAARIDVLACGAQKWLLSPWGCGFVFVRSELVRELEPLDVGWLSMRHSEDFSTLTDYDLTWVDDARRFECGTLPAQEFATMTASLELLLELGVERVGARVAALAGRIVDWCQSRSDVRLITPADETRRAGIVSFAPEDVAGIAARLTHLGVAFSVREGAIRLSPHAYNTMEEIDRVVAVMEE
ncbi:MAG TPA: aminotransferase class V-fold PLP-dependent enzyme [Gemmatimonadaceae bacterium]|nr:aminotransferase class V-fold PLP-dependent enzyme [Gemmatimonadaceae bacterium]